MNSTRFFTRSWLLWFALFCAGLTGLLLPLLVIKEQQAIDLLKVQHRQHLIIAETLITDMFKERLEDLQMLSHAPPLGDCVLHQTDCDASSLILSHYCKFLDKYDQVRLLAQDGQEMIRINRDNGQCAESPPEQLQNKANRYYFQKAMKLPATASYVSPLDLNQEQGVVEQPPKPTIRFAAPVVINNTPIGAVVVLNFLAGPLLEDLFINETSDVPSPGNRFDFLVNEQGFYLKSEKSPAQEFAFMYHRDQERFSGDYPNVWQAARNGSTEIMTREGLFLIHAVEVPVYQSLPTDAKQVRSSSRWYLFHLIPRTTLYKTSLLYGPNRWSWCLCSLLMLAFFSKLWDRMLKNQAILKKQAQELLQLHRRNELLLSSNSEGIYGVDLQGTLTFINPAAETLLGWSAEDCLGKNAHTLFHHSHRDGTTFSVYDSQIHAVLQAGRHLRRETDVVFWHKDGTPLQVSCSISPLLDEGGIHGAVVVFHDKSEQLAREKQLEKIQAVLTRAQHIAGLGVWELDLATSILHWSDEMYALFELTPETFTPSYDSFLKEIHPEDREKVASLYEHSLLANKRYHVIYRVPMPDGRIKWVEEQCHTSADDQGRGLVSIGVVYEITRQKEAEERFKSYLKLASDGIHILDHQGHVIECSQSFADSLGYRVEEVLQMHVSQWDNIIPADEIPALIQDMINTPQTFETQHKRKDGRILDVQINARGLLTIDGQNYLYTSSRDITAQKQLQKQLLGERQKYKNIIDLAADGLFILDPVTSQIVEFSKMVPKMLGYTPEEVQKLTILDWDQGFGSLAEFKQFVSQIGFEPVSFERIHTRKDGSTYDAAISTVMIAMAEGNFFFVSARDISEQKRQRADQQAREAQLRTITNASHDAILMMNPRGEISFWNPAAETILGYTAEEAMGRDLHRLIVPAQHWPAFDAGFTDFLQSGTGKVIGQTMEHMAIHKDGHHLPVSISLASVFLNNQWHAVGVIRDDTQRHLAMEKEALLRREEQSLLALFDTEDTLLFKWHNDDALSTVYASENVSSFLEVDQQPSSISIRYPSFLHPQDRFAFTDQFRLANQTGLDYFTHPPYRIITGRGTLRWILHHTVSQKNDKGRITHFIGYLIDITSQKQAEEQARELKDEFATIFNTVPIPIAYVNNEGIIYRRNEAFISLTGYSQQDVPDFETWASQAFPDILTRQEALTRWRGYLAEAIKGDGVIKPDLYWVTSKDGMVRPVAAGGKVIKGGFLATLIDMSEEEQAKQALITAREQADSANQAKSIFLANMSHEFRTPLNSIIGLTQMLCQRQGLAAEVKEELENIHISGQMLLTLINDILDLSKIEAGEINLEMIPIRLDAVLSELRAMLLPQAKRKDLALVFGLLPPAVEGYVLSDPTRLTQILLNLLTNAIKFTNTGTVSLEVQAMGSRQTTVDGYQYEQLRFSVQDTGCGIQADLLSSLFDAFKQADSSITRKYGGTGLGLAIVKQFAEAMGGEVQVTSVPGEGSCFTVDLPFQLATNEEVKQAGLDKKQFNILVAEDDLAHRQQLVTMCSQLGWEVVTAGDGLELLNRYQEMQDTGQQIDCLIVDWPMPGLDGLEALAKIRKQYGIAELPGILMLSSYESERLQNYPHADIPHLILNKPLTEAGLVNALGIVFNKHQGDIDVVLQNATLDFTHLAWLPGVKILVVDDAQTNLDLAIRLFAREGAEVFTCMDGREALEWLQGPGNQADIVLMDIQMPLMDGNTAVQNIRRIERLKTLPVIALTAAALASERAKSLQAGMDDYQTKPYDTEKMVRLIRRHVGTVRGTPVPVREKQAPPLASRPWPTIMGIEISAAQDRLDHDLDLFLNLLQRFTAENRDLAEPLLLPPEQEARNLLQARMHKLAGTAGLLGIQALSTLAKQIENSLRDGEHHGIPALLESLRENFLQVKKAIAPVLQEHQHHNRDRESKGLDETQLAALQEALQQKKISVVKLYRDLQPTLRLAMTEEAYQGLDVAIAKLDFKAAQEWLAQLKPILAAGREAKEHGPV